MRGRLFLIKRKRQKHHRVNSYFLEEPNEWFAQRTLVSSAQQPQTPDLLTFLCDVPVNTLHFSAITEKHPCDYDLWKNVTPLPRD